jgi:UDP:flavonoid glycosyltransferase YjiC (YdhE family)
VILGAGSRGDLQPGLALGRRLAAHGDAVRLIAVDRYKPLVDAAGLAPVMLSLDPVEIITSQAGQAWLDGGRNPVRFLRNFARLARPLAEQILREVAAACAGADLIVAPSIGFLGEHMAERLGVPSALVHVQPSHPTAAFPHPFVPQARRLGPIGNRWSFHAVEQLAWQLLRPLINRWRADTLGLRRLPLRGPAHRARLACRPVLCSFSRLVVPRPRDWPSYVHVTGHWFLDIDEGWTAPQALTDLLAAGDPVVYVGFGSMVPNDPARADALVRTALRMAGVRGVVLGDPATSGDDILAVRSVPHGWLFPRMSAVVHHGGAGTTAAGLRAGVPGIICPFFGDQPFWGERIAALGVGPAPVPIARLSAPALARAIEAAVGSGAGAQAMRQRSAELGARIRAEDGVARACEVLAALTASAAHAPRAASSMGHDRSNAVDQSGQSWQPPP